MDRPNKLIVEASVFSLDNPEAYIIDTVTGVEPHEVVPITTGIEGAVRLLGEKALVNGYLSIGHVKSRQNFPSHPYGGETVNKAVVVAKPLDRSAIELATGYRWSDRGSDES